MFIAISKRNVDLRQKFFFAVHVFHFFFYFVEYSERVICISSLVDVLTYKNVYFTLKYEYCILPCAECMQNYFLPSHISLLNILNLRPLLYIILLYINYI